MKDFPSMEYRALVRILVFFRKENFNNPQIEQIRNEIFIEQIKKKFKIY